VSGGGGTPDVSSLTLLEIRARLGEVSRPAEARWLAALRRDRRHGARVLAEQVARRVEARRAEARRVARLFARRRRLYAAGLRDVAGVDEVGVGPLAGPVVAAAVILPPRVILPGLADSKRLTREARERLDGEIRRQAVAISIGQVETADVDRLNILRASLEAMRRAVQGLAVRPDHVLVDARTIPDIDAPQTGIVDGDALDGSIAAASIVAKVYRDGLMRSLDARHPGYGFARHKGYATREHLDAITRLGPTPDHRRSFAPVRTQAGRSPARSEP
jgi:ribonuclease HII